MQCMLLNSVIIHHMQEGQKMAEQRQEEKRALEREHKKAERQLQREGKKPFFLKKCESLLQMKVQELVRYVIP